MLECITICVGIYTFVLCSMYHEECYNGGKMIDVLTMVSAVFGWYRYRYLVSHNSGAD